MVEKRKTKPKRKVKKKQPTQKQKQTQRQTVTVNINTKDLAKKRKPRANANSNTNRVLSQFIQPQITIPSNMINPPIIPTMFNPPPTFNQPRNVAMSILNPNPLQMGRNTNSINLTGNIQNEGEVEREIKARKNYLAEEQSLSGFSAGGMSADSLDNLENYPPPPSISDLTEPSNFSSNYLKYLDRPPSSTGLTGSANFSVDSLDNYIKPPSTTGLTGSADFLSSRSDSTRTPSSASSEFTVTTEPVKQPIRKKLKLILRQPADELNRDAFQRMRIGREIDELNTLVSSGVKPSSVDSIFTRASEVKNMMNPLLPY